eukprot:7369942-Prymnesium_polylepis.1
MSAMQPVRCESVTLQTHGPKPRPIAPKLLPWQSTMVDPMTEAKPPSLHSTPAEPWAPVPMQEEMVVA